MSSRAVGEAEDTDGPHSKRLRLDSSKDANQDVSEDEGADLLNLLDGDEFITDDQRQEVEAQKRRLLRKQRLQRAQEVDSSTSIKLELDNATKEDGTGDGRVQQQAQPSPKVSEVSKAIKTEELDVDSDRNVNINNKNNDDDDDDGDGDEFDMFSSSVSPVGATSSKAAASNTTKRGHEQQDWDDAEGYYKTVVGEVISLESTIASSSQSASTGASVSFRVLGVVGKGVFATVLKCSVISNSTSIEMPPMVAIKSIRHNEIMAKAAENEIRTLQRLKGSTGIVPLLLPTTPTPLEHRGHTMLVFTFMEYNLRDVLQKFGKGVGLSLQAVRSYFAQLLSAATHLKKHDIIHADLKPDNILVSADFGVVQLADFGSAVDVNSPGLNQPTPYLISRFYRPPEVIMGLIPTFAVDLWSIAVTVAELFLGEVVFRGKSNNDMLYVFMQHLGAFSNRVIRQHMVQCQRLPLPRHFQQEGPNYVFMRVTDDPVTGEPVRKMLSMLPRNSGDKFLMATPLNQQLLKAKSAKDTRALVNRFSDLLQKCLALDPTRRIPVKDALQHEFFRAETTAPKAT
jgi:serine/threonine-protein kinase PRP4